MVKAILVTVLASNILCLIIIAIGKSLIGANFIQLSTFLFFLLTIIIFVGVSSVMNSRKSMGDFNYQYSRSATEQGFLDRLYQDYGLIRGAYSTFIYCFIISFVIFIYSYVLGKL